MNGIKANPVSSPFVIPWIANIWAMTRFYPPQGWTLCERFPGAELVFDALPPIHVWRHNLQMRTFKVAIHVRLGIWHGQELEGWGAGIRLLDEWGFFDQPEPRLDSYRWMAPLLRLFKPMRIFHFRLGEAAGPFAWPYYTCANALSADHERVLSKGASP